MLNAHPNIHLAQEAMFYPWMTRLTLRRRSAERRLEGYLRSFSFAWLGISREEVRDRFPAPVRGERLSDVYAWILKRLSERHGAGRWGDKTPPNAYYLDRLFRDFPDARVVNVVRDPRDVVVSLSGMPFASASRIVLLASGSVLKRRVDPWRDRMLTSRLEDLRSEPARTLREVLRFVGEPWDERVLEHAEHQPPDDPPYPWVQNAAKPLKPAVSPRWPDELEEEWIRIVETFAGGSMEACGYERARLQEEPSRWSLVRAILHDLPEAIRHLGRVGRRLWRLQRWPPQDPAESQRSILSMNPRSRERHPDWSLPDPPVASTDRRAGRPAGG